MPKLEIGRLMPLKSPEDLPSYGEVLSEDTYEARLGIPSPDGLFCERIFGCEENYRCHCATLRRRRKAYSPKMLNRSSIGGGLKTCPSCGMELTNSSERFKRFGHISFPKDIYIVHPFEALINETPKLAKVFGIKKESFLQILFCLNQDQACAVVLDPSGSIETTLGRVSLRTKPVEKTLDNEIMSGFSSLFLYRLANILVNKEEVVSLFINFVPVIPPGLRPLQTEYGSQKTINDLYAEVIRKSRIVSSMLESDVHHLYFSVVALQKSVVDLFKGREIAGFGGKKFYVPGLLSPVSSGKGSIFRSNVHGKRVNFSGRSVITPSLNIGLDECEIPRKTAYELLKPIIIGILWKKIKEQDNEKPAIKLARRDYLEKSEEAILIMNRLGANREDLYEEIRKEIVFYLIDKENLPYKEAIEKYKNRDDLAIKAMEALYPEQYVYLNRAPTLHKYGIQAFRMRLTDDLSIKIHPLVCSGYNADFDGDQMAVHLILSKGARQEALEKTMSHNNTIAAFSGQAIMVPSHESVLGLYMGTKFSDASPRVISKAEAEYLFQIGELRVNDPINLDGIRRTCLGRLFVEDVLGCKIENPLDKKSVSIICTKIKNNFSKIEYAKRLDSLMKLGFAWATKFGFSVCFDDSRIPLAKSLKEEMILKEKKKAKNSGYDLESNDPRAIRAWNDLFDLVENKVEKMNEDNPIIMMLKSGARIKRSQVKQILVAKGLLTGKNGQILSTPVKSNFSEGLSPVEFFFSCRGSRKSLADKFFATPKSGYLTRKLIFILRDFRITEHDCGTDKGIWVHESLSHGRTVLARVSDKAKVRSPIFCEAHGGICQRCYGKAVDFSNDSNGLAYLGLGIGTTAAQACSEPTTQMTMRTFHTSGAAVLDSERPNLRSKVSGKLKVDRESGWLVIDNYKYPFREDSMILSELAVDNANISEGDILAYFVEHALTTKEITGTFRSLESFLSMNPGLTVAPIAGTVSLKKILAKSGENKIQVLINDKLIITLDNSMPILVPDGYDISVGEAITFGPPGISEFYGVSGDLEKTFHVFRSFLSEFYESPIAQIHYEMLFRGLSEIVKLKNGNLGLLSYEDPDNIEKRLVMGVMKLIINYPSWLKSAAFGYSRKHIFNAFESGNMPYNLPSEKLMWGETM